MQQGGVKMKNYNKPEMTISLLKNESIITTSTTPSNTLVDGKEGGQPMTESYNSLFGN